MKNKQLNQRYEYLRQRLLAMGNFHPEMKANCLQILEDMSPTFKRGLHNSFYEMVMLIEDQRLYIEHLEKLNNNNED